MLSRLLNPLPNLLAVLCSTSGPVPVQIAYFFIKVPPKIPQHDHPSILQELSRAGFNLTPNVTDGGSCKTPDLGSNQTSTEQLDTSPERPGRLEISPILIPTARSQTITKETVQMDFGPSSSDRPTETDRPDTAKEAEQTSLVKTPVNSICDFSVGEEPGISAEKEPIVIKMTDEEVIENDEPVIIQMTDEVIDSDYDADDDIITIPVDEMEMAGHMVKSEMFDGVTHTHKMSHNQMTHNRMTHNQMSHNQMLQSLRQNVPFSGHSDSKRKFNSAQFQNQRSVQPSDWSIQMTNQMKKSESSSLQFKPVNTPESRLSSSSFSSGLPSTIDFDEPGSPPASFDGFTTYVINQENYHRNELN